MIHFDRFTLSNGLTVLVHEDKSTPMVVVDVIYNVGAKDEQPDKTGFAHLFEHLMFGGSINVPEYDEPLQMAGGENNAFTTNDLTNYYCQLPAENIETAFWLESDRMLSLAFSEKSLEVQRKVVCEEFKEHYINKPYGDVGRLMRELAYTTHPYRWMTIGKELKHVEDATLQDVKDFFAKHYTPANATLVVAGNTTTQQVRALAEKWFGPIASGTRYHRQLPAEPAQLAARQQQVERKVPLNALYKAWHIYPRLDQRYYICDLITEIMGGGGSSRLFQTLVKEQKLFSNIECYHYGSTDAGLLAIEGKLVAGVKMEHAEAAVMQQIDKLLQDGISETELQKVKNKTESMLAFEDMSIMSRATSLAMYELLGDANLMNTELDRYQQVSATDLVGLSRQVFDTANSNTLYYLSAS
jgi:zinc protease